MSKFKSKKLLMAVAIPSALIAISGVVMLPIGTNKTYTYKAPSNPQAPQLSGATVKIGVGSMNYNNIWVNGKLVPPQAASSSYSDFVKKAKDTIKQYEGLSKSIPNYEQVRKNLEPLYHAAKSTLTANNLMIAGAVLFSIFMTILIVQITAFAIARKRS